MIINEVREKLAHIRDKRGWDKNVDISCGYSIYVSTSNMAREEFAEILDALMYNEKEEHHKNMEQLVDA